MRKSSWNVWLGAAALLLALPLSAQQTAKEADREAGKPEQYEQILRKSGNHEILARLEGTWRGRMSNGKYFYERYERVNDSTIRIVHFPDSTLKTRGETNTIAQRGGTIRHGQANAIRLAANEVAFARPSQPTADFTFTRTGGSLTTGCSAAF